MNIFPSYIYHHCCIWPAFNIFKKKDYEIYHRRTQSNIYNKYSKAEFTCVYLIQAITSSSQWVKLNNGCRPCRNYCDSDSSFTLRLDIYRIFFFHCHIYVLSIASSTHTDDHWLPLCIQSHYIITMRSRIMNGS